MLVPGVIVMVKVWAALVSSPPLAVPPLSCSVTLTSAVPSRPGAGVKMRVPPDSTAGGLRKRDGLSFITWKATVCSASLVGPERMAVAQLGTDWGPEFPGTDTSGPFVKLGGSFTGLTVKRNVWLVVWPMESVSVSVTRVVPNWFVAGRRVKLRTLLLPARRMFSCASNVGFDEPAVTTRNRDWVSLSRIWKVIGPRMASSLTVRSAVRLEMRGG